MAAKKQTFEAAGSELQMILDTLAREDTPLEEGLKLYARAAELISFCEDVLQKAQITVEEITARLPAARTQNAENAAQDIAQEE